MNGLGGEKKLAPYAQKSPGLGSTISVCGTVPTHLTIEETDQCVL